MHMEGRGWSVRPKGPTDLTFVLDGHGDKVIAFIDHLTFQNADATLTVDGNYTYGKPKPVRATARLSNIEPPVAAATATEQKTPQILHGLLSGSTTMVGTLSPLLLEVTGQAKGREVDIFQRHLGDIAMNLSGLINGDPRRRQDRYAEDPGRGLESRSRLCSGYRCHQSVAGR